MSGLIKEIKHSLDTKKLSLEELHYLEEKLTKEYNNITEDYRNLFYIIKNKTHEKNQEAIAKCNHNYIRYSEYHNERYFQCDKCGHEKY